MDKIEYIKKKIETFMILWKKVYINFQTQNL